MPTKLLQTKHRRYVLFRHRFRKKLSWIHVSQWLEYMLCWWVWIWKQLFRRGREMWRMPYINLPWLRSQRVLVRFVQVWLVSGGKWEMRFVWRFHLWGWSKYVMYIRWLWFWCKIIPRGQWYLCHLPRLLLPWNVLVRGASKIYSSRLFAARLWNIPSSKASIERYLWGMPCSNISRWDTNRMPLRHMRQYLAKVIPWCPRPVCRLR